MDAPPNMTRRPPPLLSAADSADSARRAALVEHLDTATPTPDALALARLVPEAVWPWDVRTVALVIDFDRLNRSK